MANFIKIIVLTFLSVSHLCNNVSASTSVGVVIDFKSGKCTHQVDTRYLSFTIDSHHLVKGWRNFNLRNGRIVYLAKSLAPAFLRLGGTDADAIQFSPSSQNDTEMRMKAVTDTPGSVDNVENNSTVPESRIPALVPGQDFLPLGDFLNRTKLYFIYGLNVLQRSKTQRQWNSSNSESLMRFFNENGIKVFGWELGNEPDSFFHVFNTFVPSPILARDFEQLKILLTRCGMGDANIIGPDTTRPSRNMARGVRYLRGFLKHGGGSVVDKVSFHQYYFDGQTATVSDFMNTTIMDVLGGEIRRAKAVVNKFAPGKPIWLGETSSGWGGGRANISGRFASSFMWLDKLGLAARNGIDVVLKQTLIGGNYGLIGEDSVPTTDYFVSLLHKKLVGTRVLSIPVGARHGGVLPEGLRLYFHCSAQADNGDEGEAKVTVFGINVGDSDVKMKFSGKKKSIEEYILQAPELTSQFVYLNGVQLRLNPNGSLPVLEPVRKITSSVMFPSISIGFWEVAMEGSENNFSRCTPGSV